MKKYPYTFEEYKKAAENEYLSKYCDKDKQGGLKILQDNEIQELIKEGYNGNKYRYEHNMQDISKI